VGARTEAVVRDPIRAIEYKSQFVGQQEVIQKRAYGKLARLQAQTAFHLTKKANPRSLLVATLVSFTLSFFGFGCLKFIVKGIQQWNCVTRDTHKLGIAERFVGHPFEYRFDVHVLNHTVRIAECGR
jgi:hypothetical protein